MTRKTVASKDFTSNGSLFGGRVISWINEEAFIFSSCQLKGDSAVKRYISNVEFLSTVRMGDIVEIGMGRRFITMKCVVRKKGSNAILTQIEKNVFVLVDRQGQPKPHYQTLDVLQKTV